MCGKLQMSHQCASCFGQYVQPLERGSLDMTNPETEESPSYPWKMFISCRKEVGFHSVCNPKKASSRNTHTCSEAHQRFCTKTSHPCNLRQESLRVWNPAAELRRCHHHLSPAPAAASFHHLPTTYCGQHLFRTSWDWWLINPNADISFFRLAGAKWISVIHSK